MPGLQYNDSRFVMRIFCLAICLKFLSRPRSESAPAERVVTVPLDLNHMVTHSNRSPYAVIPTKVSMNPLDSVVLLGGYLCELQSTRERAGRVRPILEFRLVRILAPSDGIRASRQLHTRSVFVSDCESRSPQITGVETDDGIFIGAFAAGGGVDGYSCRLKVNHVLEG